MFDRNIEQVDGFQGRQLLEEKEHEMVITMSGNSLEDAVANVFQVMRKQIYEEIRHPIIQMEAMAVYFEDVKVKKETERFLFLFMPREKMYFTITAKIIVKVKYLKVSKEDF